jgi:predicted nucleic acid-binding protein
VIHLDTSFLIRALVRGSDEDRHLRGWLREGKPIGISSIVWAEFLCGPVRPQEIELASRIFGEPAPFDGQDAIAASSLFNRSGRRRGSLVDCMIAATALRRKASLATANGEDFRRLAAAELELLP